MKASLKKINHNPYNTREDLGDLAGLTTSIQRLGLTQPMVVREAKGGYELAFGSRRYEALKNTGAKTTEIIVKNLDDKDMAMFALCENIHRKDLNAVEQARAYDHGIKVAGQSLSAFSKTIGVSQQSIKDYLGILNLPTSILKKQDKYNNTQLILLGRLEGTSSKLRETFEDLLKSKSLGVGFLKQIVSSCEKVYASNLPEDQKNRLGGRIMFHDYSAVPSGDPSYIRLFSNRILNGAISDSQKNIPKTRKSSIQKGSKTRKSRTPTHTKTENVISIMQSDEGLNEVTSNLKETSSIVQEAIFQGYYSLSSKKGQDQFKTAVGYLMSGLEEILKDESARKQA